MTTIKNAVSNLNTAISATMPLGSYLTLEISSGIDGIKTITASISSGMYSDKIDHCAVTGDISKSHHVLRDYYNAASITRAVLVAFRELMFSVNSLLSDYNLTNTRYKNDLLAFNAIIKPWSAQVSHLCDTDLVTAILVKTADNIMLTSNNSDLAGSFTMGSARNEQEMAYEQLLTSLLDVTTSQAVEVNLSQSELVCA